MMVIAPKRVGNVEHVNVNILLKQHSCASVGKQKL